MTLEDLGNIGELLGGSAVIISLLYLALQIRHSARVSKFDAHRALSKDIAGFLSGIAANPDLFRVWKMMVDTPDAATEDDRERFGMLMYQVFTTISDAERFGQMSPDLALRYSNYLERMLGFPAVRDWWLRRHGDFSPAFRRDVDRRIEEIRKRTAGESSESGLTNGTS